MKHYILTKYNIGLYSDNPNGVKDIELYMSERLELFKKTKQSVLTQKVLHPFTWILFFDKNTPKHHIEAVKENTENIEISFIHPTQYVFDEGYKITQRMDSDEILLNGCLYEVQQMAAQIAAKGLEGYPCNTAADQCLGQYSGPDRKIGKV